VSKDKKTGLMQREKLRRKNIALPRKRPGKAPASRRIRPGGRVRPAGLLPLGGKEPPTPDGTKVPYSGGKRGFLHSVGATFGLFPFAKSGPESVFLNNIELR
jgi:hypothetical protein